MAVFKCKMCGGALEIEENSSIVSCKYCGSQQTLPKVDDEKKLALFNRANNLRIKNEFDKAAGIYESIVSEFPNEAEAYWGLVLCKYGIEYVDDGKGSRIPTCHRTLPVAIMEDDDFQQACENADIVAKNIYRDEAKTIDKIQKKILNIALNEEPYDIFICYKETDDITGFRTEDSLIAQDIYTELIKDGYRVFFSRVSLREVAGTEYEPYIYAALSSAKIMLAIGTKHDYYDAVWVKNEWSRFISMMEDDSGKVLIPCFKNMDAYDMPKEFKNMQALDMGDVTFFGSLTTNIKKVISMTTKKAVKEPVIVNTGLGATVDSLLKRAFMFLEDGDFNNSDQYCEKVLDIDPECAKAYLGKLMVELRVKNQNALKDCAYAFDNKNNYQKALRFGDDEFKNELVGYIEHINIRNENARLDGIYSKAKNTMQFASAEKDYKEAARLFESVSEYKDSSSLQKECLEKAKVARLERERQSELARKKAEEERLERVRQAEIARLKAEETRKDSIYESACSVLSDSHKWIGKETDISALEDSIKAFDSLNGWRDSKEKISLCRQRIEEIKEKIEIARQKAEAEHLERVRKEEIALKEAKKRKKRNKIIKSFLIVFFIGLILVRCALDSKITFNKEDKIILKSDGTVVATGEFGFRGEHDVTEWTDMAAIATGGGHTVGLKFDGTVISAVGSNNYDGQCDFSNWSDIVAVSAGHEHTVGLKSDGTVVATGDNYDGQCNVADWSDIVAISAGDIHTVGLKYDGTVVAVGYGEDGRCDVSDWTDIVAISAGAYHTIGLKSDGTVVAVGNGNYGRCDVSDWKDIVAISTADSHTVGLKSDGTVVTASLNQIQHATEDWSDVVAVFAGYDCSVGLKADGTILYATYDDYLMNYECEKYKDDDVVSILIG